MQRYTKKSTIHILVTGNHLLDFLKNNAQYELVTKSILRTYGGVFDGEVDINLSLLASKTGISETAIIQVLDILKDAELIEFNHKIFDAEIIFLIPREDDHTINRIKHHLLEQNKSKIEKVDAIIAYAENTTTCKSRLLLRYFGEKDTVDCGICSFCITSKSKTNKIDKNKIQEDIIRLLQEKKLSSRDLISKLNYPEKITLEVLRAMNEHKIITINHDNNYQLV